jgi:hypothetical protein
VAWYANGKHFEVTPSPLKTGAHEADLVLQSVVSWMDMPTERMESGFAVSIQRNRSRHTASLSTVDATQKTARERLLIGTFHNRTHGAAPNRPVCAAPFPPQLFEKNFIPTQFA